MGRVVVSGYLVRNPLGGYAWQALHYLLGVRALGHEVCFYEDTSLYALAYDPVSNAFGPDYAAGLRAAQTFLDRAGLGADWLFVDVARGSEHGPRAGQARRLLREADVLLSIAGINHVAPAERGDRPSVFVDIDPAFTQIRATQGDRSLCAVLAAHTAHFTYGENIGTQHSTTPTAGYAWRPTRPPVALHLWRTAGGPGTVYTTVGRWNETQRDLVLDGATLRWSKRAEWLTYLDLPARTGQGFEVAMDVESVAGDLDVLGQHGWRVVSPRAVSGDPWRYRTYIQQSRGEFTVAKDLNVRLRTGWFSDRAATYLAAGRPVVNQDTGFADVLPVGRGLWAFRTPDEAVLAIEAIERDPARAAVDARALAVEYFDAPRVVGPLLAAGGL